MFGKKKPPPAVAVRITTTRTRKGKTDVVTTQAMELEPLELPEDPVALVRLYKDLKPQYENALEVTNQLAATMNQIADAVEQATDGEITLRRVGTPSINPRSSRIEQARLLAAGLQQSDSYVGAVASLPKARAGLPLLNPERPAGPYNSQPATETLEDLYPVSEEYWSPDQVWQAQQATPKEAVLQPTAYVPPQGRISGSERAEAQHPDGRVAEIRAEGRDQAEAGMQQRVAGLFANVSSQSMANAPIVTQIPVALP